MATTKSQTPGLRRRIASMAYESLLVKELMVPDQVKGTRFFPVFFLNIIQVDRELAGEFQWPETWSGGGEEPLAILRDSHKGADAFFLAAKGGRAADNHGNMDAGSFVFELDGVRWSVDPGNQNYNALEQILGGGLWDRAQDSPRWSLLTKHSGGHSTLEVNGEKHLADARAPMVALDFRGSEPQFTFDLSALYGTHLEKARRTFTRTSATGLRVSDELKFSPETKSINWQMITKAEVAVKDEIVELHQDGATLYLRVPGEVPFELRVIALSPPPLPYDKHIEGLKRLEIHWNREDFTDHAATLVVELDSHVF